MMSRFLQWFDRCVSDAHVLQHEPELAIALRQALFLIGPIAIILGIGIMAMLP